MISEAEVHADQGHITMLCPLRQEVLGHVNTWDGRMSAHGH